jgi:MFS family permease
MLVVAIGTTGLQSILPAIGRTLGLRDPLIALAFSLSALMWSIAAPFWARRMGRVGAKRMVLVGVSGFMLSQLFCGLALSAGVLGWVSAGLALTGFMIGRGIYGFFGAAAPPAAQTLIVATNPRSEWVKALTLLASAFGLGTIIGPAIAPFFVLPLVGLAGPPYVFAVLGLGMLVAVVAMLPDMPPDIHTRAAPVADAAIGSEPNDASMITALATPGTGTVRMKDPRVLPWMVFGLAAGHAQAIAGQTMAFLIIDISKVPPSQSQSLIGLILVAGSAAALFAQWGIIPRLDLQPKAMVLWGAAVAAFGCAGIAVAKDLQALAIAFAIASLGFGFLRPGFTAGASLAVSAAEQGVVAGQVTANNGISFVFGPSAGILMYDLWRPLPYLVCAVVLLVTLAYGVSTLRRGSVALGV